MQTEQNKIMNFRTHFIIQLLSKYRGELTDPKITTLFKIVEIISTIKKDVPVETIFQQINIPEEQEINQLFEQEITEENIVPIISQFIGKENITKENEEEIKTMWKSEMTIQQILHNVVEIISDSETNQYVGSKFMKKLNETAQFIYNKLIAAMNEGLQMAIEEKENKAKEEAMKAEQKPVEPEVKTIPIETNETSEEDEVNDKFTDRMRTIAVDLDKIKRKFNLFKRDSEAYGENVDYFMNKERPLKEIENLITRGIEVNELNMRVMMELDGFVGLNPENRQKRKDIIIEIQKELDENEEILKKLKKTRAIVEKKLSVLEEQRKQKEREEEEKRKAEEVRIAEEKRKEEEKKQAEQQRIAEEQRLAEQRRLEEERQRRMEEEEEQKVNDETKQKMEEEQTDDTESEDPEERMKRARMNNQRYVKPMEVKEERRNRKQQQMKGKTIAERIRDLINWNEMKIQPEFKVDERGNTLIVYSQIPGMDKNDINVTITKNGDLKICGVKKPTENELNMIIKTIRQRIGNVNDDEMIRIIKQYCYGRYGAFQRIYELPEDVDVENITMRYEEGVLQVNLPKKMTRRPNNGFGQRGYPYDSYGSYSPFNPFNSFW